MADWDITTCEDLGKELIKAGAKPLRETFELSLSDEEYSIATFKNIKNFIWDEDDKSLYMSTKVRIDIKEK